MASHAVVLLNHPPAFLNIFPGIAGFVLIALRKGRLLTAQEERGQLLDLQLGQMQVGHAELFFLRLDFLLPLS